MQRDWLAMGLVGAVIGALGAAGGTGRAGEPPRRAVVMPEDLALSPDGRRLAFRYQGDVWLAPARGGWAERFTTHPAADGQPVFSPDGKQLAFVSERTGSAQVFVAPLAGGPPRQVTHHSEGYRLEAWRPDGLALLVSGARDHYWRNADRLFWVSLERREADRLLVDAYGGEASLSPDGRRVLLVREGERWWRKGYRGSRAAQIWMWDADTGRFTKLLDEAYNCRWPLWAPDGRSFYFAADDLGPYNLWRCALRDGRAVGAQRLTHDREDSAVFPAISRNGALIAFRRLGDVFVLDPRKRRPPRLVRLWRAGDETEDDLRRVTLDRADSADFTADGLEIAMAAGGDIWVMDTELREPRQVTDTPEEERWPRFSPDGRTLVFVSDQGGRTDIWKAELPDGEAYWWRCEHFQLTRLTEDEAVESRLRWGPEGERLFYVRERGDLWVLDVASGQRRRLLAGFEPPDYDVSPDGRWLAYAQSDNDFNRDVWIKPLDDAQPPYNVSRHPHNDSGPVWSPDGRLLAFVGRRADDETDIHYVWLRREDAEKTSRDRRLETALEKMQKARRGAPSGGKPAGGAAGASQSGGGEPPAEPRRPAGAPGATDNKPMRIDLERLHERVRRISIPDSRESGLVWSPDGRRLAFAASVGGKRGLYSVEFPDKLTPKLVTSTLGERPVWLKKTNQIVWLVNGSPAALSSSGQSTTYAFRAYQTVRPSLRRLAAFDMCWRVMRDWWYDPRLGNRNWDAVRRKYRTLAAAVADRSGLAAVVHLMLGELNGSHLGFSVRPPSSRGGDDAWREVTAHLGVRFDPNHRGPGLKIRDVLPGGPADRAQSQLGPGDVILRIDGQAVDPAMDLTLVLNGRLDRDIQLDVRPAASEAVQQKKAEQAEPGETKSQDGAAKSGESDQARSGEEASPPDPDEEAPGGKTAGRQTSSPGSETRRVVLRPISYAAARSLLYRKWVKDNERLVDRLSNKTLGYIHVPAMNTSSFWEFQRRLYAVGYGKDGLVIDVRENGGGSTTDHLLTALTQPRHAITVPRGGGPGYPQERKVYATWNKPIVVLCNQNSFSNAEIFSHSIKTLGRGKLVGTPTAGGVISTGSVRIMDMGYLRRPFRGWFVLPTGEDMELNGAVPDYIVWPAPGELPAGKDRQLEKAVAVLMDEVAQWRKRPQPKLRYATERPAAPAKPPGGE